MIAAVTRLTALALLPQWPWNGYISGFITGATIASCMTWAFARHIYGPDE